MTSRMSFGKFGLVLAVLSLLLGIAMRARADSNTYVSLYPVMCELHSAKEDVRNVKDIPDDLRKKILVSIDDCLAAMKKVASPPVYIAPPEKERPYPNFKYLRQSVKEMKEAKEKVKLDKAISEDDRKTVLGEMDKTLELLEKAIACIK